MGSTETPLVRSETSWRSLIFVKTSESRFSEPSGYFLFPVVCEYPYTLVTPVGEVHENKYSILFRNDIGNRYDPTLPLYRVKVKSMDVSTCHPGVRTGELWLDLYWGRLPLGTFGPPRRTSKRHGDLCIDLLTYVTEYRLDGDKTQKKKKEQNTDQRQTEKR